MPNVVTITVEIPPDSQAKLDKLSQLPEEIPQAIKRGMDRALSIVRGRIQENRLSGKGPFPPAWHRLGERSGKLRESLREEPAVISGDTVTGAIGLHEPYGKVHEFGMLISGNPFLVFKVESFGQVSRRRGALESEELIFARKVLIPQRAPVRFGVTENVPFIAEEIGSEIDKSLDNIST
jgi:hypothetical protein